MSSESEVMLERFDLGPLLPDVCFCSGDYFEASKLGRCLQQGKMQRGELPNAFGINLVKGQWCLGRFADPVSCSVFRDSAALQVRLNEGMHDPVRIATLAEAESLDLIAALTSLS